MVTPRYSKEEFARRGDEIYERAVRPHVGEDDLGKFVVIDIETDDFEVDADELAASDRLLARNPNAQVWLTRVGSRGSAPATHVASGRAAGRRPRDNRCGECLPRSRYPPDGAWLANRRRDRGYR